MIIAAAPISSALLAAAIAANAPQYAITDMGLLPDGGFSKALGISENGLVVGEASVEPDETFYGHAVLWDRGALIDLTGLGLSGSRAYGVNNSGLVVGFTDEFSLNAFRWQGGTLLELPAIGGGRGFGSAMDVTESGLIVGGASQGFGGATFAVTWDCGEPTSLGTLGGFSSDANAINVRGTIVGGASLPDGHTHAFRWDGRVMHDLGTLGGEFSVANDVNDHDEIVGWTFSPTHAFLWREGRMSDLGTLGGLYAAANAINNSSDVVGYSYLESLPGGPIAIRAFVWRAGVMHDLNALIPLGSGWSLVEASDINDAGQIVGFGLFAGKVHGFILDPIDPSNPADLNGDGTVNGFDLALLLGAWGRCPPSLPGPPVEQGGGSSCPADLDASESVNGFDLAILLAAWG
jgi:probable HAF family extracellular repeat protein